MKGRHRHIYWRLTWRNGESRQLFLLALSLYGSKFAWNCGTDFPTGVDPRLYQDPATASRSPMVFRALFGQDCQRPLVYQLVTVIRILFSRSSSILEYFALAHRHRSTIESLRLLIM